MWPNLGHVLDNAQLAAVGDSSSTILSLACAGSGKSRTLAYRVARLVVEGEDPRSIAAFTFTEKAAESIKRRIAEALKRSGMDVTALSAMYVGTIHGFCQNALGEIQARYRQFDVLDDNRLILFCISRYGLLRISSLRPLHPRGNGAQAGYFDAIKEVANAWKTLNDELIDIADVAAVDPVLGEVLLRLSEKLEGDQFIDFSLMIRKVVAALGSDEWRRSPMLSGVRHLFVDEYQDVNASQETLIRKLHEHGATVFVVGDDDQAIYGWRGADVQNILSFQQRYGGARHTLAHNYRSTNAIVESADRFAAATLGANRISKNPTATDPDGPRDFRVLFFEDRQGEAEWVASRIGELLGTEYQERDGTRRGLTPADFAILMRSTRQREQNDRPRHEAFTAALAERGVPFSLEAGGGVFSKPIVLALVESFELLRDGSPSRERLRSFFDTLVLSAYPRASFERVAEVFAEWGRRIHLSTEGARRRVFPQELVHDLLEAFGVANSDFDADGMRSIGLFSRVIQDVESVYLSVDSADRFKEVVNFLKHVAAEGYDISTDELVSRPDAVSVMTVHKAKGLEFPVVFIVDVEQRRFPKRRESYRGWLPVGLLGGVLTRGAYGTTVDGEARLFYTALTRAERYLYVTGAKMLPGGRRAASRSSFATQLQHEELVTTPDALTHGLVQATPARRVDDSEIPTTFSEVRYFLRCPHDYQLRKRFNFSPPIPELFGFGKTVHTAIERLHQESTESVPALQHAAQIAADTFHLKHVAMSRDVDRPGPYERARDRAVSIVSEYVRGFGGDFAHERQVEARFEVPSGKAVISGSIDLLLELGPSGDVVDATVIDFKSMEAAASGSDREHEWTDLSLQVQLYARGAQAIIGNDAKAGSVHFLKDGRRVEVPVHQESIQAALKNVEWAVERIAAGDFPMRPTSRKCAACDFARLCQKQRQEFSGGEQPPDVHTPYGPRVIEAFQL